MRVSPCCEEIVRSEHVKEGDESNNMSEIPRNEVSESKHPCREGVSKCNQERREMSH